jgi:TRAP-type C4-dicarboxylate transport system permease small subunit
MRTLMRLLLAGAKALCGACFACFCLLTLVQVVNRYALGLPLFWTEEVALLLFVWSVMIGLPVALWTRQEMVVDVLSLKPGPVGTTVKWVAEGVSLVFLVLLAAAGIMLIDRAGSALTPALGWPRWLSYAAIPAGAGLGAMTLIGRHFRAPADDTPATDTSHADHAHD